MQTPPRRGPFYSWGIARLKADATLERARANLAVVAETIKRRSPGQTLWNYSIVPLQEEMVGPVRRSLYLLLGAVGFLLLIATANVANLLLARAGSREQRASVVH